MVRRPLFCAAVALLCLTGFALGNTGPRMGYAAIFLVCFHRTAQSCRCLRGIAAALFARDVLTPAVI